MHPRLEQQEAPDAGTVAGEPAVVAESVPGGLTGPPRVAAYCWLLWLATQVLAGTPEYHVKPTGPLCTASRRRSPELRPGMNGLGPRIPARRTPRLRG